MQLRTPRTRTRTSSEGSLTAEERGSGVSPAVGGLLEWGESEGPAGRGSGRSKRLQQGQGSPSAALRGLPLGGTTGGVASADEIVRVGLEVRRLLEAIVPEPLLR